MVYNIGINIPICIYVMILCKYKLIAPDAGDLYSLTLI